MSATTTTTTATTAAASAPGAWDDAAFEAFMVFVGALPAVEGVLVDTAEAMVAATHDPPDAFKTIISALPPLPCPVAASGVFAAATSAAETPARGRLLACPLVVDSMTALRAVFFVWRWVADTNKKHRALATCDREIGVAVARIRADAHPSGPGSALAGGTPEMRAAANFYGAVSILRAWERFILAVFCVPPRYWEALMTSESVPDVSAQFADALIAQNVKLVAGGHTTLAAAEFTG